MIQHPLHVSGRPRWLWVAHAAARIGISALVVTVVWLFASPGAVDDWLLLSLLTIIASSWAAEWGSRELRRRAWRAIPLEQQLVAPRPQADPDLVVSSLSLTVLAAGGVAVAQMPGLRPSYLVGALGGAALGLAVMQVIRAFSLDLLRRDPLSGVGWSLQVAWPIVWSLVGATSVAVSFTVLVVMTYVVVWTVRSMHWSMPTRQRKSV